jgi:hypothetical protein
MYIFDGFTFFSSDILYDFVFQTMNILPLILFISFCLTTNAQWHIKKTDPSKSGIYRNPGKRSVLDQQIDSSQTDCSKSFFQLNSYQEQVRWIFTCLDGKLPSQIDDNSISSESDDILLDSISTSIPIPTPSDDTEYNSSFNKFLSKLRQGGIRKRK